jgi:5'-deoxynucleotidase YfbR-like HD superfamily hydrolase
MNIVKLFSVSQGMSAIQRYSQLHLLKSESVMEHTGFVCLFTYNICEEINAASPDAHKLNTGKALQKAIVHDIDEVITGDIPRPTKYYSEESKALFDKISEAGIDQIIRELEIEKLNMKNDWKSSKSGREGAIVAFADLSSVVYKLWEEILMLGNRKLFRQSIEVGKYLMHFERKVRNDSLFTQPQKRIIYKSIEQLYDILRQIAETSDPVHGTMAVFEDWDCSAHHK